MDWYDRQGNPLTMEEASRLFEDMEYKRVAETTIGPYWVSTVWLGLDHSWRPEDPPQIFETMVFADPKTEGADQYGMTEFDTVRYASETEARQGHEAMCLLIRATTQEEFDYEGSADADDHRRQEDADGDDHQEPGRAPGAVSPGSGEVPGEGDRAPGREAGPGSGGQASGPVHQAARAR